MDRVLVLNASYEPLSLVSVKRAVVLLLTDKAEVVEQDVARQLHAERIAIDVPLVIRLVRYITIPRGMRVPLSRKTLLARNEHTCQYCGTTGVPLTVEHLQLRSRGASAARAGSRSGPTSTGSRSSSWPRPGATTRSRSTSSNATQRRRRCGHPGQGGSRGPAVHAGAPAPPISPIPSALAQW